jgi:hypothetical protein
LLTETRSSPVRSSDAAKLDPEHLPGFECQYHPEHLSERIIAKLKTQAVRSTTSTNSART